MSLIDSWALAVQGRKRLGQNVLGLGGNGMWGREIADTALLRTWVREKEAEGTGVGWRHGLRDMVPVGAPGACREQGRNQERAQGY